MDIYLHNTLGGTKQEFKSITDGQVLMYNCGPTVYGRQHIGNLSMFVFTDILRKSLEYAGYEVRQVINFTDFGHLSGDNEGNADEGEDRMQKGLKREGMELTLPNMRLLAEKYANIFLSDLNLLNIDTKKPSFPYASDYIPDQIKMIETLLEKGHAYIVKEGVYFDTSTFPDYGKLGNINLSGLKEGARVKESDEKKNPTDFVLWKSAHGENLIGWESPWGIGFPGWHIECSAMILKLLGEQIDIHTGGIEHIPVHHNNEIAQSESFTGKKPFSRFWLHREHLKINGKKISKSEGEVIYVEHLKNHGIHPLSFRYWLLTSHYRTPANFTWEAVEGAQNAYEKAVSGYFDLPEKDLSDEDIITKFEMAIADDLNTPVAIALLQEAKSKYAIEKIDEVLGLNIGKISEEMLSNIPTEILDLKKERESARTNKDWQKSDLLRSEIENNGFVVEDIPTETRIRKPLSKLI